MQLSLTHQVVEKIIRYRNNPILFCKEQCKIQHPTKGMIPFQTFPAQEQCIRDFLQHRFNIILKSRQIGISTVVGGYCFWKMVFFPHQQIRVVATKKETAQIIITMAYNMLQSCDPEILRVLNAQPISEAKQTVELANGSRMTSFAQGKGENPDTGVGTALSLLVIDEAALIKRAEDIWTTIYPTLSQGGDCIILSTPRGNKNWFAEKYKKATNMEYSQGEIPFNAIKLMWWENLDRINPPETPLTTDLSVPGGKSNSWSKGMFAGMSLKEIAQEYCVAEDTIITLRDKETNKIFDITFKELWENENK